jgi:hypothetical protein
MDKSAMHVLSFSKPALSRYRPVITTLLIVLCIPLFFYHLVPTFTHATDGFMSVLVVRLRDQASRADFCTSEVGSAHCCGLFLDASPCTDDCRKQHVDKVTYALTQEYEDCADKCLAQYNTICKRADNGSPFASAGHGD